MKPNRDAAALAASLTIAANAPLPLPHQPPISVVQTPMSSPQPEPEAYQETPPPAATPAARKNRKLKVVSETKVISLRPTIALLTRYTRAAAERTMKEGRVVSAQEMMLEVLERGPVKA